MSLHEELKSAGTYPTGPVSAWPKERHDKLSKTYRSEKNKSQPPSRQKQKVRAGVGRMVRGLTKTTAQAISQGRVDPDIREQRYQTCKDCEHFIPDSKRCAECGCFMEMKTWIGGDPSTLCPLNKWLK